MGKIVVMLFDNLVPKTCNHILDLCSENLYDGSSVQKIIPGEKIEIDIEKPTIFDNTFTQDLSEEIGLCKNYHTG